MTLGELPLDKEAFLASHWQREPLFIPNGFRDFSSPLPADELAGLALEEHVESRIIECRENNWLIRHGPFQAGDYDRAHPWTLLVQAVDHYIPAVARLLHLVDFLPKWRVDDVMASYAVDGGSVGPHYDNYDVFLLQGEGSRLWRLGQRCDDASPLLPNPELRILQDFETTREYLLGPGDILYVPPGIAHWGIAQGECTTFSIGFRAPRLNDMVSRWADRLLESIDPEIFFQDPASEVVVPARAGEIRPEDMARARSQIRAALDKAADNHWLGELVTEPRYDIEIYPDEIARARKVMAQGPALIALSPAARVAWQQETGGVTVYANGQACQFDQSVLGCITELCSRWRLEGENLARAMARPTDLRLLEYLLENGGIYVE